MAMFPMMEEQMPDVVVSHDAAQIFRMPHELFMLHRFILVNRNLLVATTQTTSNVPA